MAEALARSSLSALTPEQQRLLDDIEAFIRPYRSTSQKPNLSIEFLVVVAVCFNQHQDSFAALRWVVDHFEYYRNIALDEFCDPRRRIAGQQFRQDFSKIFSRMDVPIVVGTYNPQLPETRLGPSVDAREARIFLGLNKADTSKPFRFLELAPEIRNTIYEMALTFPKSGVNVARPTSVSKACVSTLTSDNTADISPRQWYEGHSSRCAGRRLSTYLDVFRTSKQFYTEAMPIFYSTNTFVARNNEDLNMLMANTPEHRRKHFQHVIFLLNPTESTLWSKKLTKDYSGLRKLNEITDLKVLDIAVWEDTWLAVRKITKQREQKYTNILKIPPMQLLEQFRGLNKVNFHGNCDNIKAHLEALMTKPKIEEVSATSKTSRKRKAKEQPAGTTPSKVKTSRKN